MRLTRAIVRAAASLAVVAATFTMSPSAHASSAAEPPSTEFVCGLDVDYGGSGGYYNTTAFYGNCGRTSDVLVTWYVYVNGTQVRQGMTCVPRNTSKFLVGHSSNVGQPDVWAYHTYTYCS
ncbi:hypothetical protein [Catellatospora sp. NPDC049609]|uniref:hypothetical protein n=1 Tax=Catellatospora sp. NPDC049609 TaxID=3155505 RepID=UPI00343BDA52